MLTFLCGICLGVAQMYVHHELKRRGWSYMASLTASGVFVAVPWFVAVITLALMD